MPKAGASACGLFVFGACQNSGECIDFVSCMEPCDADDQPCIDGCAAQFPEGSKLYAELFDCVFCYGCLVACANAPFSDPSPGCP